MERPARLCGLWALLLCAGGGGGGGGAAPTETQPPVTNLSVSVENLCTVIWTWDPPEGTSPNCTLRYFSHFDNKQDKKIAPETHRSKEVPLNERICLQVGSQCSTNESDNPSILVEKCTPPPEGDPESAVTELQCVWHNLSYMKCTWLPGRNTSPDTNYTLYYWHSSLGKILQCENIYREGQHIGCSFALTNLKDSSFEQHSVQIVVKDNAGKIRPSFNIVPLTSHVKPDPPHIKRLFFQNGNLYVQWKNPQNFYSRCLSYQVEVNNSQTETHDIFYAVTPEGLAGSAADRSVSGHLQVNLFAEIESPLSVPESGVPIPCSKGKEQRASKWGEGVSEQPINYAREFTFEQEPRTFHLRRDLLMFGIHIYLGDGHEEGDTNLQPDPSSGS
uniref:interleukin-13 receptor subunit alpha-1 isoform X3 n=1 Tax=Panthera onca TaxID=9690 RepID=UPI00295546EC|nr:interleukin-13 receptor subunit alpha-1 isoform X3 [Panthera onca]